MSRAEKGKEKGREASLIRTWTRITQVNGLSVAVDRGAYQEKGFLQNIRCFYVYNICKLASSLGSRLDN